MIFLIEYNRKKGMLVNILKFLDIDKEKAEERRLKLEIKLNRKKINHEVVLLQAKNLNTLKQTHQRYFEDINGILDSTNPRTDN